MTDYYSDVLHTKAPTIPTDENPNLSSIAKLRSQEDIIKFLRLVVALALKSNKNEAYVSTICTFSPESQKALMYLLQRVPSLASTLIVGIVR
jgi:HOOK domain